MAFDLINSYRPRTFDQILTAMTAEINTQFGTTYDTTTIIGTEFYRFFYAGAQEVMKAEAFTAEITAKMTDYIRTSNENINLPKSTIDGFIQALKRPEAEGGLGLDSTIKNITDPAEGGHLFLVVDTDSGAAGYAELKQKIFDKQAAWLSAGLFYEGAETGTKTAINGQVFDYAFDLPTAVDILVRITVTVSANSTTPILNENQIRNIFNTNFSALYRIGLDFEPEKYLEIARDLPFASEILLEYSEDAGATWDEAPRAMAYNEKINITAAATISVV
jgi:hypothetical protein